MSNPRPALSVLLWAVIVAAAAQGQAASGWNDLSRPAQTAISRAIASDQVGEGGGLAPQTIDTILQTAKLGASGSDSLGASVAISGDVVVAGVPFDSPAAAYVFVKPASGWADTTTFAARLTTSDGVPDDEFGQSVAILGDTVVVGASQRDSGSKGAAYIYLKPASGWKSTSAFTAKLTASGGANGDSFGETLAMSENTIVVGAPNARVVNGVLAGPGQVYVFEEPAAGWATTSTFAALLKTNDGHPGEELGKSLAVFEDTVVAGAPGASAAYVFVKPASGWVSTAVFDAKITVPDSVDNDSFGQAVAVSDETIVVGVPYARIEPNSDQGSAYLFEKPATGWVSTSEFQAILTASDGGPENFFGASVALSGRTVLVGAPAQIDFGLPGAVYVFVKPSGGWTSTAAFDEKLTASGAEGYDAFGSAAAASDGTLAVGAPAVDGFNGAVYLFEGFPSACTPGSGTRCLTPVAPAPAEVVGPRP